MIKNILYIILFVSNVYIAQSSILSKIEVENMEGEKIHLSDYYKNGPLYISFWATWCIPCRSELKVLQSIYDEVRAKDANIIAISIDNIKSVGKVKSFFKSQKYSFPCFIDPNSEIFKYLNGQDVHYSILVDNEGKVIKINSGYEVGDEKLIKEDIIRLINKKNAANNR